MIVGIGRSICGRCFLAAIMVLANGLSPRAAVTVEVPGTSNPWLAGMPRDTSSGWGRDFDYAPEHSPVPILGISFSPGAALQFKATGAVSKGPGLAFAGPDGDLFEIAGKIAGGEHGIADLIAPKNALVGVFLGPNDPDFSPAPAALSFSSAISRDFRELRPGVKQPFFIGDGANSSRAPQRFIVPENATRLFLGTMDGVGWYNNEGAFSVELSLDQPVVSISDLRLNEGDMGVTRGELVVELSRPASTEVSVRYATVDGTATIETDYAIAAGTLAIQPGETAGRIEIKILGDAEFEPDETFFVRLSEPVHGILQRNQGTVTIVNDDIENLPPTVRLLSPAHDATYELGAKVRLVAAASDPDGSVAQVEFLVDGVLLGLSRSEPYEFDWDHVAPGEHFVLARATDNFGATVSTARVRIVVVDPVPVPPTVSLSAPSGGAQFAADSGILVSAIASDRDGEVRRVDFFADSVLIGSRSVSPFRLVWTDVPAGRYDLRAEAIDDSELRAVSEVVSIAVRDFSGDVAIVRSNRDPEIDAMKEYLDELGFSAREFLPGEITREILGRYFLVVWLQLGPAEPVLMAEHVSVLSQVMRGGIPIYFIGEDLAAAADLLDEADRARWSELTHVRAGSGNGPAAYVEFPDTGLVHPIVTGRFGLVDLFEYPATAGVVSLVDSAAEVLGRSGRSDVLVAYPSQTEEDFGRARSVIQSFFLTREPELGGYEERKELFQNAACWLMRCAPCDLVNVRLEIDSGDSGEGFMTGEPLEYSIKAFHSGECEATGVVITHSMPAGVVFVSADSEQGTWSQKGNTIMFHLGRLEKASMTEMTVRVIPVEPGILLTRVEARMNGPEATLLDNVAQLMLPIDGESRPILRVRRTVGGRFELYLTGAEDRSFIIQESGDLRKWTDAFGPSGESWLVPLGADGDRGKSRSFFRAIRK